VGAALGVEVRAALAAPDGQAGESVLERLLEPEELDDAQVHAGVEPQAALVRTERGVELDSEAAVDLHRSVVVHPRHAEDDLPLGLTQPLNHAGVLGVLADHSPETVQYLVGGLVELALVRVATHDLAVYVKQFVVQR